MLAPFLCVLEGVNGRETSCCQAAASLYLHRWCAYRDTRRQHIQASRSLMRRTVLVAAAVAVAGLSAIGVLALRPGEAPPPAPTVASTAGPTPVTPASRATTPTATPAAATAVAPAPASAPTTL